MNEAEWDARWGRFIAAHNAPAPPARPLQAHSVAVVLAALVLAQALALALAWFG